MRRLEEPDRFVAGSTTKRETPDWRWYVRREGREGELRNPAREIIRIPAVVQYY